MIDLSKQFHPQPKPLRKNKANDINVTRKIKQTSLPRTGKKTNEWKDVREVIKARFKTEGITECELQLKGCWKNTALGFAHIDKRRNLQAEDMYKVVLACGPCHDFVEYKMETKEMRKLILSIIKLRAERLGHS